MQVAGVAAAKDSKGSLEAWTTRDVHVGCKAQIVGKFAKVADEVQLPTDDVVIGNTFELDLFESLDVSIIPYKKSSLTVYLMNVQISCR